jgi:predicted SprT family Zn-dependent metalloprotease
MNRHDAAILARTLMNEHGLGHWAFQFDRSVRRFGVCRFGTQTISMSQRLVELNEEARVRNTILHEIAHALVGPGHGHNHVWRNKARSIGCDGRTCVDSKTVALPEAPWVGTCPGCRKTTTRHRLTAKGRQLACARCCRGRWNPAYVYVWERKRLTRATA